MTDLERIQVAKEKEYLTLKDIVLLSSLSESTIRSNIKLGKLKSLPSKPRQRRLFRKSDVMNWIERGYEPTYNNA